MIVSAIFSRNTTFYKPYYVSIGKYIFLLVLKMLLYYAFLLSENKIPASFSKKRMVFLFFLSTFELRYYKNNS